jgi:hypothetical protein
MLRNRFLIAVLAILLIAVAVYNYSFFASRKVKPPAAHTAAPAGEAGPQQGATIDPSRIQAPSYRPQWTRDPFWYHDGAGKQSAGGRPKRTASADITLEGTTTEQGKGYAIIDGQVIETGETIRGYTIVSIGDRSVVLRNAKGTRTLTIANDLLEKEN